VNAFASLLIAFGAAVGLANAQAQSLVAGPFNRITIDGSAAVRFTQGESDSVQVEGSDEARRAVEMGVQDGRLKISTSGAWKFWAARAVQVNITARKLQRVDITGSASFVAPQAVRAEQLALSISGAGSVRFDQLQADELKFSVSGSGDGVFNGQTRALGVAVSGRGKFEGEHLASDTASVAISGVAQVGVWARQTLSIAVAGSGTVDYWGAPQVKRGIAGHAVIRHHGDKPAPKSP
jgi:Putative auto-transporter adhesin, head GIN domain